MAVADLNSAELKPYKAALVVRVADGEELSANQVLKKIKKILGLKATDKFRKVVGQGTDTEPESAFVRYEDRRQVPWARFALFDKVNHLVVVIRKGNWVAIHMTETSRRLTIAKAMRDGKLGSLSPVSSGQLKAAFIKGRARTLWLRGTHRSSAHKADTKVLGGRDLAGALDPIGDQSYRYTAARCEPDNDAIGQVMGLAVDHSRFWVGPSGDWQEFESSIVATLDELGRTEGADEEPLPILAAAKSNLDDVNGAYDVAVTPPELVLMGPVLDSTQAEIVASMEQLAFATHFEITDADGTTLTATVSYQGEPMGEVEIRFRQVGDEIEADVSGQPVSAAHREDFNQLLGSIRDPDTLTVYFESGHTIQSRQAFSLRHRDLAFDGWTWVPFDAEWELDREKPRAGLDAIGDGDRSLFSWVLEQWATVAGAEPGGWLACDDRPGETADFLHLDDSGEVPTLTLIHAKGAHSSGLGRGIAVVPYETVSAQAIKNIRHLDTELARGNLLSGIVPAGLELLAWENGASRSREQFVERLGTLGANFRRRVVIVQPHVRKQLVDEVRADPNHTQLSRLRQLDTLLNGVAADCRSAGAEFVVVSST